MRYKKFIAVYLTLLFLTGCGLIRSKEKVVSTSKQVEVINEETSLKDAYEEITTGKEVTSEKSKQTEGKEASMHFKGELEVINDIVLEDGLNILKTESGGTVFVVKEQDDKLSLIINRPDINVFNKDYNILEEVRGKLKDSSKTIKTDNSSEYSLEALKVTSDSVNKTKTKPNMIVILAIILVLIVVVKRLKIKYKK